MLLIIKNKKTPSIMYECHQVTECLCGHIVGGILFSNSDKKEFKDAVMNKINKM